MLRIDFSPLLCYNALKVGDDMKNKTPHPERYFYVSLICLILLFLNFYRTDSWTGDKPFSEFVERDWQLLAIFLIEEFIIVCVMVAFWILGNKNIKKRNAMLLAQWEKDKYSGIRPADYDYVWFDFSNAERALILKQDDIFKLYVQEYDERTGNWESFSSVSVYDDLDSVKRALFYDFEFFCKENAEFDELGDEEYVEEIKIPITSVNSISKEEILYCNSQGCISKIIFADAYKSWCEKYHINKPDLRYICDRTNTDGERRMIFYGNPHIIFVAQKEHEELWFKMIEKMKSFEYFVFDRD